MERLTTVRFEKISGVYALLCSSNGKFYVGSSFDIALRLRTHLKDLRKKKHCNRKLQSAWNKYGSAEFSFYILERCPEELRIERETFWITEKDAFKKGFNIRPAAELAAQGAVLNARPRTTAQREGARARITELNKTLRREYSEERREKQRVLVKKLHAEGKLWTPERRAKMSARTSRYNESLRGRRKITKGTRQMTVLVLCHGSICRSPFAKAVMQRAGVPNVECAGFKKPEEANKRSPGKIRAFAQSIGLDLEAHRSQSVSRELLAAADFILYMDSGQLKRLEPMWEALGLDAERGPLHARLRPLGAFLTPQAAKIGDPNFQHPDSPEFKKIMAQVVEASEAFATWWLANLAQQASALRSAEADASTGEADAEAAA